MSKNAAAVERELTNFRNETEKEEESEPEEDSIRKLTERPYGESPELPDTDGQKSTPKDYEHSSEFNIAQQDMDRPVKPWSESSNISISVKQGQQRPRPVSRSGFNTHAQSEKRTEDNLSWRGSDPQPRNAVAEFGGRATDYQFTLGKGSAEAGQPSGSIKSSKFEREIGLLKWMKMVDLSATQKTETQSDEVKEHSSN